MEKNNEFDHVNYSFGFLLSTKWFSAIVFLILFTLISYIPFSSKLDSIVSKSLNISNTCRLKIKDYRFEFFLPKVVLENVNVPSSCLSHRIPQGLNLQEVKVGFRGLSFVPFGLSLKLSTEVFGNKIETYSIISPNSLHIKMESESENGKFVSDINKVALSSLKKVTNILRVEGDLYLSNIYLEISFAGKIKDMAINIASNNFVLPKQKLKLPIGLGGEPIEMSIDKMPINSILIQGISEQRKILIDKFIIGDEKSPVKAQFTGDVKLNLRNINMSPINFKGELGFGKEFIEKYSILNLALGQFDKKDNFYQIQLKGMLGSPNASSAR